MAAQRLAAGEDGADRLGDGQLTAEPGQVGRQAGDAGDRLAGVGHHERRRARRRHPEPLRLPVDLAQAGAQVRQRDQAGHRVLAAGGAAGGAGHLGPAERQRPHQPGRHLRWHGPGPAGGPGPPRPARPTGAGAVRRTRVEPPRPVRVQSTVQRGQVGEGLLQADAGLRAGTTQPGAGRRGVPAVADGLGDRVDRGHPPVARDGPAGRQAGRPPASAQPAGPGPGVAGPTPCPPPARRARSDPVPRRRWDGWPGVP